MLKTISPLDNRYLTQSQELSNYFSEFAFCKYRIRVEISWFQFVLQNFYKKEIEKKFRLGKLKKHSQQF